jgi:tricorn protease
MRRIAAWLSALLGFALANSAVAETGYYRHPALHGDIVVFTAEGDLWRASTSGGVAQRLTTHPAEESQAAISPDGELIAFVASYDAAPEVYVMPLAGGMPRRLSADAGRVFVQGFDRAGRVVYASENVIGPSWRRVLRAVDPDSGRVSELPLADASEVAYTDDGKTLWFTRFGLHVTGDNARDYRGGAKARLWRWGGAGEAEIVAADFDANLSHPMWWQGQLYAIGDVGGAANLWRLDEDGSAPEQLTRHSEFEVRQASHEGGRIVYQLGADLHLYDIATGTDRKLSITLASDFEQRRARHHKKPLAFLSGLEFAPAGDRVVLAARGRIALAGTGSLRRIEIGAGDATRLREAVLSPDGKAVYAIADRDGGSEIVRYAADGTPGASALTQAGEVHRWRLTLSPDGRWLAHSDKQRRLWLLDTGTGANRLIDRAPFSSDDAYGELSFSPDSHYLAFVRSDSARDLPQVFLREIASGRQVRLTSDKYESFSPAFSRDGRWLWFLSNRSFQTLPQQGPWGDRNTGPYFDRRTKIYALALQPDTRFPFLPRDELGNGAVPVNGTSDKPEAKAPLPDVAFDGLTERLYEVPLPAGNYSALEADAKRLYFLARDAAPDAKAQLMTLAIDAIAPKAEAFAAEVQSYALSADASKLMYATAPAEPGAGVGAIYIVPSGAKAPAPEELANAQVRIGDWVLPLDPALEWRQMFADAWRMHRQFSFDPAMRGVDWDAVRTRYEPLLARVADRAELDDLLGQMSAEHGILHSQVRGAEYRADPEAAVPALLGAVVREDDDGLLIERIYRTEVELPSERGPLQQAGVDAREGDRLLAVNGRPLASRVALAEALANQAGQQVMLTLARGRAAPHRTVVVPIPADRDAALRYGDWVQGTRAAVESAGKGRIGYLHLRAMGPGDMAGFVREFYANHQRDGLIIDVRRNRGGNIDSWVIEKLLRRVWAFWQPPDSIAYGNMQQSFRGHLVVLADQLTYSDGETFAAGVKALGLGPVIGMRTAGAGIWLSDRNTLADNGVARVAEFPQFDREGRWLIEGAGVAPDIAVDNPPHATWKGEDAQLTAALDWLTRKLAAEPVQPLQARPVPPRGQPGHDGSP